MEAKKPKLSIIFLHYSVDEVKSYFGFRCLKRLWALAKRNPNIELIVVNNGWRDANFKTLCHKYIESSKNSMGFGRNLGFDNSSGEFVCFIDNDIYCEHSFWIEAIELLEKYPDKKLIATPIYTPCHTLQDKYNKGELDGHLLNTRSGSNCLLMRRTSFEEIGRFPEFDQGLYRGNDGVKFCNMQIRAGYLVIHTRYGLARDIGLPKHTYK